MKSQYLKLAVLSIFIFNISFNHVLSQVNSSEGWDITTSTSNNYTGVVVANGRIGILPSARPFEVKSIILNNVYDKESPLGVSRILEGMNFGNLDLYIDDEKITASNITNWKQTLHMKEGSFTTAFTYKDIVEVEYTIYTLQNVQYSGYIDFKINAKKKLKLDVYGKILTAKEFKEPLSTFRVLKDNEVSMPILQTVAKSNLKRHLVATSATFIFHDINSGREDERPKLDHVKLSEYNNQLHFSKQIDKNSNYQFAWTAAECTTADFNDPQNESERMVIFNLLTNRDHLLNAHKKVWKNLWSGDIIIEGDVESQKDVRLALYHLYSFSRADSDLSISPMGLSSQNYNGHIFWDSELWMYPPLLALHQDIARSLINYRSDRLEKAKQKAKNFGYKGAMFPWESDDTGEEATPAWALTGTFEHHITADIGIAFWNYYRVTKNKQWLLKKGYPMLKEIADYWVSRSYKNNDGSYSILNVVGANEFAPNVDDNAFTNGSAITCLKYAVFAAEALNLKANAGWTTVAENIKIHRFPNGTTMEHSKYKGEIIKQADVNLLTYPLNIISDKETVLKDLEYYEPKLAVDGPAMGQSIFAIIYARLGNAEEAYRLFKKSYIPNKRPPFGALAESATSNNPYFATGAGGMLQVVLFGFGGLHITDDGIVQKNPILPKKWKSLIIKGVGPDKHTFVIK
jgi:trehalose/maltose hydrolase-like predicted phosphorylase